MARVLVVEDDASQRFLIEMMLNRAHHNVSSAVNGEDALRLLATDSDYDVILSDLQMPGMDGADLLCALAAGYPQLPVIVMTVHAGSRWVEHALQYGATACLAKPFFGADLAEMLETVLHMQSHCL